MKTLYTRLEKTSSTLERMGSELETERREHMHLQVQYQEAQVLVKSQQERIDQLEAELSTVKAVSKREKERLVSLHKIEIEQLQKMKTQEIEILMKNASSRKEYTPAILDAPSEGSKADDTEAFLAYLDAFEKKGRNWRHV